MQVLEIEKITVTDYYSFGAPMPGRGYTSATGYRYGFNGKENDNEVKGQGNQQDYGMRIYDTRLGKFLSVDPLSKKFAMLTPYQFASNTPIQAIDLDGLEAAVVRTEVQTLIITIQGYNEVNPPAGKTQAGNNKEGIDISGISYIADIARHKPEIQVVAYSSSQSDNTKQDVLETIKNFQLANPNGQVIIAGHSLGADNAIELVNENPQLKIDMLITVDILDNYDDDNIPSNVKDVTNFYNAESSGSFGGEQIEIDDPNKTKGQGNVPVYGTVHKEIDNVLKEQVAGKMLIKAASSTYKTTDNTNQKTVKPIGPVE